MKNSSLMVYYFKCSIYKYENNNYSTALLYAGHCLLCIEECSNSTPLTYLTKYVK